MTSHLQAHNPLIHSCFLGGLEQFQYNDIGFLLMGGICKSAPSVKDLVSIWSCTPFKLQE